MYMVVVDAADNRFYMMVQIWNFDGQSFAEFVVVLNAAENYW